jgi:hypothetical protein
VAAAPLLLSLQGGPLDAGAAVRRVLVRCERHFESYITLVQLHAFRYDFDIVK